MVVLQRNEVSRNRVLYFLTILLAIVVLVYVPFGFSGRPEAVQLLLVLLGASAILALVISILQVYSHPRRSLLLLFHREDQMVVATNAIHEGFKLRFLRDVLGESVTSFSDEERVRWKSLEPDGFYATLCVRNVRKLIMLRLCTMIFDDVFIVDQMGRWEHHDSSCTSEPTFSRREMPPLKSLGKCLRFPVTR